MAVIMLVVGMLSVNLMLEVSGMPILQQGHRP